MKKFACLVAGISLIGTAAIASAGVVNVAYDNTGPTFNTTN